MRKFQKLFVAISLLAGLASCRNNTHRFVTDDGKDRLEAEYSGRIAFDDKELIGQMSNGSYFKVDHNGKEVTVKCDASGKISYVDNDGNKSSKPDGDSQRLIAEGVRSILKIQRNIGKK